ncbi:2Fe-2S iron-sulfur cluster-binding protein [Pricia sp. S334]|uniref:2Fe-2S iron-sulfur cluster-binding protein n=1 Tax=Pricia mediterranea TaxID=3076079 RepID=A0ABU3L7D0_9FLAO|nr:2Fe-2S iron-sulfur cluster-binding protein [Pricia sp. S334]MDT7829473.1 2Fe-2S iron-sulfur cluster-binding protein [Pricia sp. S334]
MAPKTYSLSYFNEFDEECDASFIINEYHSLMELLFDKYIEDWGDCKGRAWCGTCHIQIIEGNLSEKMDVDERHTLSKIGNATETSRLACQIPVNAELHNLVFKMMGRS